MSVADILYQTDEKAPAQAPAWSAISVENLSAASVTPAYAKQDLLSSAFTGQSVEFYGDSITEGLNLPDPATQRYATLVCDSFTGCTQLNNAVPSNQTWDLVGAYTNGYGNIWLNHSDGHTVVVNMGFNDVGIPAYMPDNTLGEVITTLESAFLYLMLPSSTRQWASTVTRTGTWTANTAIHPNTGAATAMTTSTASSTASATVTGRVVGFSVLTPYSSAGAVYNTLTVVVDGVTIVASQNFNNAITSETAHLSSWNAIDFTLDTYSAADATHTISVTYVGGTSSSLTLNYFYAFSPGQAGANSLFALAIEIVDYNTSGGTDARRFTWNRCVQELIRKYRQVYQLPAYYVGDPGRNWIYGMKVFDDIHPNVYGHMWIANRVLDVISNGEYVYWNH